MSYVKGELVHCSADFKAYVDGVLTLVDPAVVKFSFSRPGLTAIYTYGVDTELKKLSTGKYYVDLDTTPAAGKWYYKFWSTGSYQAAQKATFDVDQDDF